MKYYVLLVLLLTLFLASLPKDVYPQSWKFAKEKDGIKIYTRDELNCSLKSYKGEVTFKASINKVNLLVGDAKNLDWWDKNISNIKVIDFKRNKFIRYYLVYHLPWPLSNRDLALESQITTDSVTGERTVISKPLFNVIPEKKDLVRIKKYWQKWTVQPMEKGYVHVILEGFVDPNGNIPSWLYNMVITETPYNVIYSLRERAISAKPASN
jgi:hypothetical protein